MPDYKNYNEDRTKKICFVCKDMLSIKLFRVRNKKTGRGQGKYVNNTCRDCEGKDVEKYRMTDVGIAAEIVRRKKSVSKSEKIPFDLTRDWVLKRLNEIGWRCELTGLPFNPKRSLNQGKRHGFQWDTVSVDRIFPKGGYVMSNVRFVLNQINIFRQDHSDDQMFMLAKALIAYKQGK